MNVSGSKEDGHEDSETDSIQVGGEVNKRREGVSNLVSMVFQMLDHC